MSIWIGPMLAIAGAAQTMPSFPSAWELSGAGVVEELRESSPVVKLDGLRSTVKVEIKKPTADRRLELTVWMKGTEELQWVSVDTKAWRTERGRRVPAQCPVNVGEGFMTTEYARLSTDWKPYRKTIKVSRSAETLTISVQNITRAPLFVSTPSFAAGQKELADLDGPGIIRARINVWVKPGEAKKGKISFPVPMLTEHQVPLAFKFDTDPVGAVKSYSFRKRRDAVIGDNWICDAEVEPGSGPTRVSWESLVLVKDRPRKSLATEEKPSCPKEVEAWLRATTCVQTGSAVLRAKADELAKDNPDVETYVRRVIKFSCDNRGTGAPFNRLDAEYAMQCGGSCTSRANLAAALLRIKGIPARTVAHLPTWAYGEVLFTHWLVEYWHPNEGWIPVESTWAEFDPPTTTYVVLAISSPQDEDGSENAEQLRWVMPGAPEWTMARLGSALAPDTDQNQQSNWAKAEVRLTGSTDELDQLFDRGRRRYEGLVRTGEYGADGQFEAVERAMVKGSARDLLAALK